jgi:hypothetical protein
MAKIGIFWVYKDAVIGRARPINEGADVGGRIDSPDTHLNLWEQDRTFSKPSKLVGTEYQTLPRGRVVWIKKEKAAVVYMDKVLLRSEAAKKKVAAFFDLESARTRWESDPHYTTDPDEIDSLLSD